MSLFSIKNRLTVTISSKSISWGAFAATGEFPERDGASSTSSSYMVDGGDE